MDVANVTLLRLGKLSAFGVSEECLAHIHHLFYCVGLEGLSKVSYIHRNYETMVTRWPSPWCQAPYAQE